MDQQEMTLGASTMRADRVKAEQKDLRKKENRAVKKSRRIEPEETVAVTGPHWSTQFQGPTGFRVYAASAGPFVKVGYTTKGRGRISGLQTGNPLPVQFVRSWPALSDTHARKVEAFIHSALHEYRACGEWFLCELDRVDAAAVEAMGVSAGLSWDLWNDAVRKFNGPGLPRNAELRRRQGAASIKAASKPDRYRELSDALVEYLVGFDPVAVREESARASRAKVKANRQQGGKKRGKRARRRSSKANRRAAGSMPTEVVVSSGRRVSG